MLGCVNRNVAGSAGTSSGHRHPWSAFIASNFGFSLEELLYFRLILKEWKIGIGIKPRKDETKG